jgi:hypothetical protein
VQCPHDARRAWKGRWYSLSVYRLCGALRDPTTRHVARSFVPQLLWPPTIVPPASPGHLEWVAKVVVRESDETQFWIIFTVRSEMCPGGQHELWHSGRLCQPPESAAAYRTSRRAGPEIVLALKWIYRWIDGSIVRRSVS